MDENRFKRIAILGIVLGVLGILGSAFNITIPTLVEAEKQRAQSQQIEFEREIDRLDRQAEPVNPIKYEQLQKGVARKKELYQMHNLSSREKSAFVYSGSAGLILSFLYILSSIFLLRRKESAAQSLLIAVSLMLILNLSGALQGWHFSPRPIPLGTTLLSSGLLSSLINLWFLLRVKRWAEAEGFWNQTQILKKAFEFTFSSFLPAVFFGPFLVIFSGFGLFLMGAGALELLIGKLTWQIALPGIAALMPSFFLYLFGILGIVILGVIVLIGVDNLAKHPVMLRIFLVIGVISWTLDLFMLATVIPEFIIRFKSVQPSLSLILLGPAFIGGRYLYFMLKQIKPNGSEMDGNAS